MKFPNEAKELVSLMSQDQEEWKAYAKAEYVDKLPARELQVFKKDLRKKVSKRGNQALQILNQIGRVPSLDNIGSAAAIALSVLATHYSLDATKQVLAAFERCYMQAPQNTQISSIPAMTDWVAVLEHQPQKFGTIWLFDSNNHPFLPTVEDFENINERRKVYELEPFRWPKSLAIPEEDQPWLKRPVSEAVMRAPTNIELQKLSDYYS